MTRPRFFGQFLLERGAITPQSLLKALSLQTQTNENIGNLAIRKGLLTSEDVRTLHKAQRTLDKRMGELAVARGLLDETQTQSLLEEQRLAHVRLGEALVKVGAIAREALTRELDAFENEQAASPKAVAPAGDPQSALIERTLRLTQTLFHRLAHINVKLGGLGQAPSEEFAHCARARVGGMTLYVAYQDGVAKRVTSGMLGFEAENVEPADLVSSHCEFVSALATQLGGDGRAESRPLPAPLPAGARLFELYTASDTICLVFDTR